MNIFLWILQVALALHTAVGAFWKFSHSAEQTMPSLAAIPHGAWITLSVFEIVCAICLIFPVFAKRLAILAPLGAVFIAIEMLLFCGIHLYSGDTNYGPMIYWLVVAAVSGFVAYGRFMLRPLI